MYECSYRRAAGKCGAPTGYLNEYDKPLCAVHVLVTKRNRGILSGDKQEPISAEEQVHDPLSSLGEGLDRMRQEMARLEKTSERTRLQRLQDRRNLAVPRRRKTGTVHGNTRKSHWRAYYLRDKL